MLLLVAGCTGAPVPQPVPSSVPASRYVVELTATGAGRARVTWASLGPAAAGPTTEGVALPWSRRLTPPRGGPAALTALTLLVDGAGVVTCRIAVDGRTLAADRARGGASCTADLRASELPTPSTPSSTSGPG